MTRIAILTPSLSPNDAVGNDIVEMTSVLRKQGHTVRIYAKDWLFEEPVHHVSKINSFLKNRSDILIYHYSVAWDTALQLFQNLNC